MKFGIVLNPELTADECIEVMEQIYADGVHCNEVVEYIFESNGTELKAWIAHCKAPIWRAAWFVVRNSFKFLRSLDDGLPVFGRKK